MQHHQRPTKSHVQALPSAPVVSWATKRLASVRLQSGPLRTGIDLNVGLLNMRILQGCHFSWDEELETTQAIVNMFSVWYTMFGCEGGVSHSGRRTFITNAARKISTVGGSLRDVQMLAGHSSLAVTQRYIEGDGAARAKVVELV